MFKDQIKLFFSIIIGAIIAFYIGAMIDFFPFVSNELVVREIGFCMLIICGVIAICTSVVLENKKNRVENKRRTVLLVLLF